MGQAVEILLSSEDDGITLDAQRDGEGSGVVEIERGLVKIAKGIIDDLDARLRR